MYTKSLLRILPKNKNIPKKEHRYVPDLQLVCSMRNSAIRSLRHRSEQKLNLTPCSSIIINLSSILSSPIGNQHAYTDGRWVCCAAVYSKRLSTRPSSASGNDRSRDGKERSESVDVGRRDRRGWWEGLVREHGVGCSVEFEDGLSACTEFPAAEGEGCFGIRREYGPCLRALCETGTDDVDLCVCEALCGCEREEEGQCESY